ncbi:tyrosine-type recombinase/integrase [Polyangium aurulentum]|uniref:tyrosine-type recombinase/integrase n=1 Tax=Polyangium aurulentum TaxID=2567896 RepID=UPI00146F471B|nr:tyrosine-type recombinase/integrase [Polyangium aurulentum]UQA60389.1 tyrosine-type recombinase/integrase [Polyangium aurulentum]
MTIRKETRRGEPRLVIDINYRKRDGRKGRYRRDAQVQTHAAARTEERRLLGTLAQHGEPFEPAALDDDAGAGNGDELSKTFGEVVAEYRATYMVTDLKITTRRGYGSVLDSTLVPRFGELPLAEVDGAAACELDLELCKEELSQSTRNNVQAVLRSVLRFAVGRGYLSEPPGGLPRLKPIGQSILEIPSDEEVRRILEAASEAHRRSFAIMAYAGLRPNEVRALRRRDVRLRWQGTEAVGGFLSVREGQSHGQTHTPKTGQREVPIAAALARLLGPVERELRDGFVAVNDRGEPWGQWGLDQAFERVRKRAGLEGWSVYCLRHYAITMWLRRGGAGACGAEDGRAQASGDDAEVCASPQGGSRGGGEAAQSH